MQRHQLPVVDLETIQTSEELLSKLQLLKQKVLTLKAKKGDTNEILELIDMLVQATRKNSFSEPLRALLKKMFEATDQIIGYDPDLLLENHQMYKTFKSENPEIEMRFFSENEFYSSKDGTVKRGKHEEYKRITLKFLEPLESCKIFREQMRDIETSFAQLNLPATHVATAPKDYEKILKKRPDLGNLSVPSSSKEEQGLYLAYIEFAKLFFIEHRFFKLMPNQVINWLNESINASKRLTTVYTDNLVIVDNELRNILEARKAIEESYKEEAKQKHLTAPPKITKREQTEAAPPVKTSTLVARYHAEKTTKSNTPTPALRRQKPAIQTQQQTHKILNPEFLSPSSDELITYLTELKSQIKKITGKRKVKKTELELVKMLIDYVKKYASFNDARKTVKSLTDLIKESDSTIVKYDIYNRADQLRIFCENNITIESRLYSKHERYKADDHGTVKSGNHEEYVTLARKALEPLEKFLEVKEKLAQVQVTLMMLRHDQKEILAAQADCAEILKKVPNLLGFVPGSVDGQPEYKPMVHLRNVFLIEQTFTTQLMDKLETWLSQYIEPLNDDLNTVIESLTPVKSELNAIIKLREELSASIKEDELKAAKQSAPVATATPATLFSKRPTSAANSTTVNAPNQQAYAPVAQKARLSVAPAALHSAKAPALKAPIPPPRPPMKMTQARK